MPSEQNDHDPRPQIRQVTPPAAIPGGEFRILGEGFQSDARPQVSIGDVIAPVVVGSDSLVLARVPDGASVGELIVRNGNSPSAIWNCEIGVQIADSLHPVASPAVDRLGNIYTTFSGARGQKTPVSVFKIDLNYNARPFAADILNATGLAIGPDDDVFVSSRQEGIVYQVSSEGTLGVYVEGMGVATGLAFDDEGNLFVGDRSGTIFKFAPSRQVYVFATLEPSIAAYHLAFGPDRALYVTGPTTSSFDVVHRVSAEGVVDVFFRGLGRPQGLAFDVDGNLYVAASLGGQRGVVKIGPDKKASLFVSGPGVVGLAFTPSKAMVLTTNNSVYRVDAGIRGWMPGR